MRISTCVLALLAAAGLGGEREARPATPAPQLIQTRFELVADLDYDEGRLAATATLEVENRSPQPATSVPLNLGRLMLVSAVADGEGLPLTFDQDVVTFTDDSRRQVTHVTVALPRPLAAGDRTTLAVTYAGHLVGYTETGSRYIRDRIAERFTILREDAYAFPGIGLPSSGANRAMPRTDFAYDVAVTVPESLVVATGGELVDRRVAGGRATYRYRSRSPVPFLNIPIAPYRTVGDDGVTIFHFPEDSLGARRILDRSRRAMRLMTEWMGPVGTAVAFTVMEIPEGFGSQASLSAGIIQTADAFRDAGSLMALYHEISHFWNAPDTDRPAARWNEGLATFLQLRIAAALDGWDGMDDWIARAAARQPERVAAAGPVPFAEYGREGLTDLSYLTGLLMFSVLHEILGDATFDAAIGGYYQRHRGQGGSFDDLVRLVDAATPIDLAPFFEEWVYSTAWMDRLERGESLEELAAGYISP